MSENRFLTLICGIGGLSVVVFTLAIWYVYHNSQIKQRIAATAQAKADGIEAYRANQSNKPVGEFSADWSEGWESEHAKDLEGKRAAEAAKERAIAVERLNQEKARKDKEAANAAEEYKPVYYPAAALMREYEANEIAADANNKGRVVLIQGRIDAIETDITGAPYVTLKTNGPFFVQCMFEQRQKPILATLSKGQVVKVGGTCSGRLGNIFLRGGGL